MRSRRLVRAALRQRGSQEGERSAGPLACEDVALERPQAGRAVVAAGEHPDALHNVEGADRVCVPRERVGEGVAGAARAVNLRRRSGRTEDQKGSQPSGLVTMVTEFVAAAGGWEGYLHGERWPAGASEETSVRKRSEREDRARRRKRLGRGGKRPLSFSLQWIQDGRMGVGGNLQSWQRTSEHAPFRQIFMEPPTSALTSAPSAVTVRAVTWCVCPCNGVVGFTDCKISALRANWRVQRSGED